MKGIEQNVCIVMCTMIYHRDFCGSIESYKKLLAEQLTWVQDLIKFVQFAPGKQMYNKMEATIEDVLKAQSS